ncbi:MAG TPA: N-formylglutamate amidohydrolase [Dehalococcoidia bacterium]|nr:N-formylglutamate amidohydrolase [Dehalococcoidia bacterium]
MRLFNLHVPPENRIPVVASLPHSGSHVPPEVKKQFRQDPLPAFSPLDWHLERLYDFLPELGITVIHATHSRYVVNLNRSLTEPLFGPENTCVVPENTCFSKPLYEREPTRIQVERRVSDYYSPYHRKLSDLLEEMLQESRHAYLLDLHSYYRGPEVDVCLGNVNGVTCSPDLIDAFERSYRRHGFRVVANDKWIGGHITRYYGAMDAIEALQIELRFPAYLEGDSFEEEVIPDLDSDKFRNARERLRRVFAGVINDIFPS